MRKIRTKVYKFSELSESAKETAIEQFYNVNVSFEWWEGVYEDAANIGLKITGFDIDRGSYCKMELGYNTAYDVATKIIQEHGNTCETYKTASQFITDWDELVKQHSDGVNTDKVSEDNEYEFDLLADELEKEFIYSLSQDYLKMLRDEYEYMTSKEAIIETIEADGHEFTKDGKQF